MEDILSVLRNCADDEVKNVTMVCPSFTVDCLETLEEISIRDFEVFQEISGEKLELIPSLNSVSDWVEGFADILKKNP
jgi:ferrochelatase